MAATDMFLKATGQKTGELVGESNDKAFPGQIEVVDWSWGLSAPSAVSSLKGRTALRELTVVKRADRASTALMSVLNTNELLTSVVLTVRKAGGQPLPYFVVKLQKARISEYDVRSSVSNDAVELLEHIKFTYKAITVEYTLQDGTGSGKSASSFSADAGD